MWWWRLFRHGTMICGYLMPDGGLKQKVFFGVWRRKSENWETVKMKPSGSWVRIIEAMSVDSVSVGTRTPPCNPAGWTVRRSLHRLTGWIHANESFLLNIGHTIFRQLGIKYKYLEFLAEGTPAMTTTSSTSLAIPMRQHVQSGERHLQDHDIHLQNHHN